MATQSIHFSTVSKDEYAHQLYSHALDHQFTHPSSALSALISLIDQFPETWTVQYLVIDAALEIALKYGFCTEALQICQRAQDIDRRCAEIYRLEAEAIQLELENRIVEATKKRLEKDVARGKCFGTLQKYAETMIQLGDFESASRLLDEAAQIARTEGLMLFDIMRSRAVLLRQQGRTVEAVEHLIEAFANAADWKVAAAPFALVRELDLTLREIQLTDGEMAAFLAQAGMEGAVDEAKRVFHAALGEKGCQQNDRSQYGVSQ